MPLSHSRPHLAPMQRQYVANRQKEEDEAREKETASVIILASPSIALLTSIANSYIAMHCRNYCCHQGQEPQYPGIQNMCWSKSEMGRLCTQPFYRYWECVENWNGLHPFSLSFPRRSIVIRLRLPIDVGRKEVSGWVMDQDDWSPVAHFSNGSWRLAGAFSLMTNGCLKNPQKIVDSGQLWWK